MKTSELISKLQESLQVNGDIPVFFETYGPIPVYELEEVEVALIGKPVNENGICLYCDRDKYL